MSSDGSSAFIMVLCVSALCIGFGLLTIFARDFMWELTAWGNSWKGLRSERTEGWEASQAISGIILILIGVGFGCWGFSQTSMQAQREAQNQAEETQVAATASANIDRLKTTFGALISEWQSDDSPGIKRVRVPGISAKAIYYGRCDGGYFYVIIRELDNQTYNDYAYVPDSSPQYCKPDGLLLNFMNDPLSMDDGWWDIDINSFTEDSDIITPTPSRTPQPTPTVPTATPNAAELQLTIDAAVQAQVTQAASQQELAITQTIAAAVQGTLTAAAQATP
ncbi:MAG: hypothetical protein K8L97_23545 [Anaerolineae bacterium]|nr:hypothetical protein [Anaerolineae bacterium]